MSFQFRILDNNLVFNGAVTISASSQNPNFPASNVAEYFRSKVWRSSALGNFVIGATNNKLDFKHNGGAQLTATITSGTYNATTLAAEIVTRMNTAAGGSFFTVGLSASTGLWTITSSATSLSLLFGTGTNAASSVAPALGFAASDRTGALSYTGPNVAIHTEEWVMFDMSTTEGADSVAILFDSVLGPKLTASAVVTVQANATNVWTAPAFSQALSLDTSYDIITYFQDPVLNYRYWRIKVVDPQNPNLYIELGKVLIAQATQLTQVPDLGFTATGTDTSVITSTPYGHRYADVYPRQRTFDFAFSNIDDSQAAIIDLIHARVGTVIPIAIALDATATIWDKDRFFVYGYLAQQVQSAQVFYNCFNITGFTITEGA